MDIRRRTLFKKKVSSGGGSTTEGSYTVNLNSQWESTTAVPNPDSTLYDGVYRSLSSYNVDSGVSIMYITIKDCSSFKMYIRSYAESNYDYVMVSQLDKTINGNTTYSDTTLVKAHTRGNQQSGTTLSNYTLVEFTGITSGEHTITVVYRKDGSVNSGDDRGYVLIEKMQADSGDSEVSNYLTIEALEDGLTASLSVNACEYCVDGDGNWKSLSAGTATEAINTGQVLSFRGELTPVLDKGIGTFTISKKCNLKGNCMSMLFGDNAADNYSLSGKNYAFYMLFKGCSNIINISNNFLPAMTLSSTCYFGMFYNCTSLITAPDLPAITLADYCYTHMFYNCTSLTIAPELPATTLSSWCYGSMFERCTSLATTPTILPATTLADRCYDSMFRDCTSLTTAPELPATTLAYGCYEMMFDGCNKLNYIKMLATDISANNCLYDWVEGVASTGTFVKNPAMTTLPTGESGIPRGWIVMNDLNNYLTIEALEDGLTASLSVNACEYCVDGDGNWKTLAAGTATEAINSGQTLSFRGELTPSGNGMGKFTISKKCNLKGNCMSMLFGDNAADNYSLRGKNYAFYMLFEGCSNIVNVSSNFLPATTLSSWCYRSMFRGCTSLTTAPELPATTLANSCYREMFYGCTSLTTAPELPATTLANECYYDMFRDCTRLTTAPELPATTLASGCYCDMFRDCTRLTTAPELPATTLSGSCYFGMFYGCTRLTTAPELPATTLADYCYYNMFYGCTALTTAPELPATTLTKYCYCYMFYGCRSLTTAPELPATTLADDCYSIMFCRCTSLTTAPAILPATTLADRCYQMMFSDCTSLTTAPELPATTLAYSCYDNMFYGCINLNYIKMLATDISATNCLHYWVYRVASTGTFVKNPAMTTLPTGESGIPSGWTVQDAEEESSNIDNYLTIEALEDGLTVSLSTNACEYCVDGDGFWSVLSPESETESIINSGQTLSFRGELTPNGSNGIGTFTINKKCNLKGNCMSMLFGDEAADNFSLSDKVFAFYGLFRNCTNIVNVSSNFLPATTLASGCYQYMFNGCTSLTTAPELPATTLADYCYDSMFYGCTGLTTTPELPVTTLAMSCYHSMFNGCTSLTTAPELPATTLAYGCYNSMFNGCTSLTTAPELPATTLVEKCYYDMFYGCTSLTTAPELPATTLASWCYHEMFRGCTSLTTAPELPATILSDGCYCSMFYGCTSLTTVPELPATTLAYYCYQSMFRGCTRLTSATELPATTLAERCYEWMFNGCTSLTTAPELPATTLTYGCYSSMFNGCTSLTMAPELPATTLADYCYSSMFKGCSKLNYIKMLATDISASNCLYGWVRGVASTGTFVKNPAMTTLPTGTSSNNYVGIPSGWTVLNA